MQMLGGRSLLAHTGAAIEQSNIAAPVILTTDSDEIAAEGERLGWTVPFRRPADLATDSAPTIDAVLHVLDWYRDWHGADPEAVMVLQPTSPLRGSKCLVAAVALLDGRPDVDSVIGMTAINVPAEHLYLCATNGYAVPLSRERRKPVYIPNGALYLTRTRSLRAEKTLYAGQIVVLPIDRERSIDIDTEADLRLAEAIFAQGLPPEESRFLPVAAAEG